MKKGSTGYVYFEARSPEGDRMTGLTVTCVTSLDGGAATSGPTVHEIGTTGVYYIELTSSLTNGKCLAIIASADNAIIPLMQVEFDDYALTSEITALSSNYGSWSLDNGTLTIYDASNTRSISLTVTKDGNGNITNIS